MRRNCPNCGERFEGDICPNCLKSATGSDKSEAREAARPGSASKKASKSDLKLLLTIIAVMAVIVCFILYRNGVIGGGSFKKPIEQYFTAICERDFESYVGSMLPEIQKEYSAERSSMGYSEYEYMEKLYSDFFEEFGDDLSITIEFNSNSRLEQPELGYFLTSYEEIYGSELKSSSILKAEITARFSGSESETDAEMTCCVVRLGRKWYVAVIE